MAIFGWGGVSHKMEEQQIQQAMNKIGGYIGSNSNNCERCNNYMSPSETGSQYYGGCRLHSIKVFSSHVCDSFQ